MGVTGNGAGRANGNGAPGSAERRPRRVVLLAADRDDPPAQVLAEYQGAEATGNRLHAEVRRLADEQPGRYVAAEWLGPRGWTRFLWRRADGPQTPQA